MSHRDQDEDTVIANNSQNPHFAEVLQARLSRRKALLGGLSATTAAVFGGLGLSGCESNDDNDGGTTTPPPAGPVAPKLNFSPVDKATFDRVGLPAGYTATVLYALGDPIKDAIAAYKNDGTDTDHDQRAGDHHDGMSYFGLGEDGKWAPSRSDRGLLCMNHENITQKYLHAAAPSTAPRNLAEVRKEMHCHGVSVVEIRKDGAGKFAVVQDSDFNRRITPFTEMEIRGPVRGSKFVVTKFSPTGQKTRGTLNNCANGYTPWGTYLTAEENWNGYFRRNPAETGRSDADKASLARYGVSSATGNFAWASIAEDEDSIKRLDISADAARTAAQDYRNEANTYGWIVEIDPFDPTSTPRKRTTMGRFGHEGAWPARPVAGRPVVFYMGDDRAGDYIYKFVSAKNYDPADRGLAAGDKYLDEGTLYVATFNSDGSGSWKALAHGANGLTEDAALYPFTSQAAVLVNTRLAADHVGATRMDRPEWAAVNPFNGEVYLTLTNNSGRTVTDAANPRRYKADGTPSTTEGSNINGHVIRWREDSDEPAATSFKWDVYLFGSRAAYTDAAVNASGLTDANDFSSPDGLWFDPRGVLWIQTDDGAYTDVTNCMMLAAVPGKVGDGAAKTLNGQATFVGKAANATDIRRFLVGPKDCEITGLDITPDGKTMFVNIQHPGDGGTIAAPAGSWPNPSRDALAAGVAPQRPRSATICITRTDGGVIGL